MEHSKTIKNFKNIDMPKDNILNVPTNKDTSPSQNVQKIFRKLI